MIQMSYILLRKRYGIQKRYKNVMGLGLSYIYGLVLTQFTFPLHALKMSFLQTYKENFGVETIFWIWWQGNVIESLCRWKDFKKTFYHHYFFQHWIGSRLFFNIIIYLKASKRLPEFGGLKGNVYPGQLKPRFPIPEPRRQSIKNPFSLEWNQKGFSATEINVHVKPTRIILVEPVSELE